MTPPNTPLRTTRNSTTGRTADNEDNEERRTYPSWFPWPYGDTAVTRSPANIEGPSRGSDATKPAVRPKIRRGNSDLAFSRKGAPNDVNHDTAARTLAGAGAPTALNGAGNFPGALANGSPIVVPGDASGALKGCLEDLSAERITACLCPRAATNDAAVLSDPAIAADPKGPSSRSGCCTSQRGS